MLHQLLHYINNLVFLAFPQTFSANLLDNATSLPCCDLSILGYKANHIPFHQEVACCRGAPKHHAKHEPPPHFHSSYWVQHDDSSDSALGQNCSGQSLIPSLCY